MSECYNEDMPQLTVADRFDPRHADEHSSAVRTDLVLDLSLPKIPIPAVPLVRIAEADSPLAKKQASDNRTVVLNSLQRQNEVEMIKHAGSPETARKGHGDAFSLTVTPPDFLSISPEGMMPRISNGSASDQILTPDSNPHTSEDKPLIEFSRSQTSWVLRKLDDPIDNDPSDDHSASVSGFILDLPFKFARGCMRILRDVAEFVTSSPFMSLAQECWEHMIDRCHHCLESSLRYCGLCSVPKQQNDVLDEHQCERTPYEKTPKSKVPSKRDSDGQAKRRERKRTARRAVLEKSEDVEDDAELQEEEPNRDQDKCHVRQALVEEEAKRRENDRIRVDTLARSSASTLNNPAVSALVIGLGTHYDAVERVLESVAALQNKHAEKSRTVCGTPKEIA